MMQITNAQPKAFSVAFRHDCGAKVNCIEVSLTSLFAIGTSSRTFVVNLQNCGRVKQLEGHVGGTTALCFSPEGDKLYTGGANGTCKAFQIQANTEPNSDVQDLVGDATLVLQPDQPHAPISYLVLCPKSSVLAVGCSRFVKLVDLSTNEVHDELEPLPYETKNIVWLDAKYLLATHARGYRVWNYQENTIDLDFTSDGDTFSCFAVAPNGVLAASCADKKMVYVWRLDSWLAGGERERALEPAIIDEYDSAVRCLAWDRKGRFLATSDGGTATVWDFLEAADNQLTQSIICSHSSRDQRSGITCLSFQPEEPDQAKTDQCSLLVTGGDDSKLVFFNATNFRPGGIESVVMTISIGGSTEKQATPDEISAIKWLDTNQPVICMSSGKVVCLTLCLTPETMTDSSAMAPVYQINGPYGYTPNDVAQGIAERLQISQPSLAAAASTVSTRSSSSSLNGTVPANGRGDAVHDSRVMGGAANPAQVDPPAYKPETPPQRKKEVARVVHPAKNNRQQRPQDKASFTSNVMRPYTNRQGGSSSVHQRVPSPTRSSSSSKESGGAGGPTSAWMMTPGAAAAPGWGMAPGMAPGGMQFAHMPGFNPALHPQMMSPMPFTYITPRPSMPGGGNMAGAAHPGAFPAAGGQMSPKAAVPAAFFMQSPLSYPTPPGWAAAGHMAWPQHQQQQLRHLFVSQAAFYGNPTSSKPPGVGSVGMGGLIPMGMEPMGSLDTGQGPVMSAALQLPPESAVAAYPHMDNAAGAAPLASIEFPGDGNEPMVTTLYVGNLAPTVEEMSLGQTFSYFGYVTNVQVIRDKQTKQSRGFGFVTFLHPTYARLAMSQMNGKVLYGPFEGRKIKVAPSSRC